MSGKYVVEGDTTDISSDARSLVVIVVKRILVTGLTAAHQPWQ
jgi:hypothetical protein